LLALRRGNERQEQEDEGKDFAHNKMYFYAAKLQKFFCNLQFFAKKMLSLIRFLDFLQFEPPRFLSVEFGE